MSDYILYVIVRNDLASMNPGKAEAHSGHAASAFLYDAFVKHKKSSSLYKMAKSWAGKRGFGTQINLDGSIDDIETTVTYLESNDFITIPSSSNNAIVFYDYIIDKTYPYTDGPTNKFTRKETTAFYLFGPRDIVYPFVSNFRLK
jgi:hypothetical protein